MSESFDMMRAMRANFERSNLLEFPFFSYPRQGGRTAVEILARAFVMEGKYVYIGARLGARSRGTNEIVFRTADTDTIPKGLATTYPSGLMFMHEDLLLPIRAMEAGRRADLERIETLQQEAKGLLMVCSAKAPEDIKYPLDFEGSVATVDAEGIFIKRASIEPAPSGITALGLFLAATGDLISLETVKKAIMQHERLGKRVRELNVECMQEAYEKTRIAHNIKRKGEFTPEEYLERETYVPSSNLITGEDMNALMWKNKVPVCDTRKCVCIECLAAYFCGAAAIGWEDEALQIDYDFCRGCGTCAKECPENAITMEPAEKVREGMKV
ncbi:2-oxoacid:acceptor oxidoreductase family protein [Chloroflexota bacterium]